LLKQAAKSREVAKKNLHLDKNVRLYYNILVKVVFFLAKVLTNSATSLPSLRFVQLAKKYFFLKKLCKNKNKKSGIPPNPLPLFLFCFWNLTRLRRVGQKKTQKSLFLTPQARYRLACGVPMYFFLISFALRRYLYRLFKNLASCAILRCFPLEENLKIPLKQPKTQVKPADNQQKIKIK